MTKQHSITRHPLRDSEDWEQIRSDVQFVRMSWPIGVILETTSKGDEMITRSLIELHHDTGYGDGLLSQINGAIRGKDMEAKAVIVQMPLTGREEIPEGRHPVQKPHRREQSSCPTEVTMAAYQVYCELYGPQQAIVTGDCRGGFGTSELIAFLYARSFPRSEWRERVNEAFNGMVNC